MSSPLRRFGELSERALAGGQARAARVELRVFACECRAKRAMRLGTRPAIDGDEPSRVGAIAQQARVELAGRSPEECGPRSGRAVLALELLELRRLDHELP